MIGLIGGMSWESSASYYRLINEAVRDRIGPMASAPCLMWSFDFEPIERLQQAGEWPQLGRMLSDAAMRLEAAGAQGLVLCTNTMHRLAEEIEAATTIPLLHIVDPTAEAIKASGRRRVALLGTGYTMEGDFYRGRLHAHHGLEVLIPPADDRDQVHRIIYEELIAGRVLQSSRETYQGVIQRLVEAGAEGIILGCTEIGLLISQSDSPVPIFDTTHLHAQAAAGFVLGDD
jgi:aspartate racemase